MRVETNGVRFVIGDAEPKIVEAGEYVTDDPTEIELLTSLADAGAVQIVASA
jgi:hypothetical protein